MIPLSNSNTKNETEYLKNYAVYKCNSCLHNTKHAGTMKSYLVSRLDQLKKQQQTHITIQSSIQKKKKAKEIKKQNTLQGIVKKNQQQKHTPKASLQDFLKTL